MTKIPVYQAEIDAGLETQIQASNSLAYVFPVKSAGTIVPKNLKLSKATMQDFFSAHAGLNDADLYFCHSILVSSVWNKNDEVFLKEELIKAKDTPIYKKVNLDHDETKIIGAMVASYMVDDDGNLLTEENVGDAETIHILNSSVVYKKWVSEDLQKAVSKVIEKIEAGEQFVSMECLFTDYDYCVMGSEGKCTIVERNPKTAFLSKALRIYGGTGEYQTYKVGRIPRNLIFSGKGFVDKPANPDSVTFTAESITDFITAGENIPFLNESGVSFNREDTDVSNTQELEIIMANDNTQLVESLTKDKVTLESTVATLTSEKTVLASQVTALTSEKKVVEDANAALKTELDAVKTELATATKTVEEVTAAKAEVETKYNEIQAQVTEQARVNILVAGGLTQEAASAQVKAFSYTNDEQFAAIAALIVATIKPVVEAPVTTTASEVDAENAEATLESAEVTPEPTLTAPTESAQASADKVREDFAAYAKSTFNFKTKK